MELKEFQYNTIKSKQDDVNGHLYKKAYGLVENSGILSKHNMPAFILK